MASNKKGIDGDHEDHLNNTDVHSQTLDCCLF